MERMTPLLKKLDELEKVARDSLELLPLEIVQGDCAHRLHPGSGLNLNTSGVWAVSQNIRSPMKARNASEALSELPATALKLIAALRKASEALNSAESYIAWIRESYAPSGGAAASDAIRQAIKEIEEEFEE